MGTYLITHITAEGSHEDVDKMLSVLQGANGVVDKTKLEQLSCITLQFNINANQPILFSSYETKINGKFHKFQRVLLVKTPWLSRDFDDGLMYALSAIFPLLLWKIYTDDTQQCATCQTFELGLKRHDVWISGSNYMNYVVEEDYDFEVDTDGLKNKLDSMIQSNDGLLLVADSILKNLSSKPKLYEELASIKEPSELKIHVQFLIMSALNNLKLKDDCSHLHDEIVDQFEKIKKQIEHNSNK